MAAWTHLIRFIAVEDDQIHLGQPVDVGRDIGHDSMDGLPIKAHLISGNMFEGYLLDCVYTVKRLLFPVSRDQCTYIRCLGLIYINHAKATLPLPHSPELFTKPRAALTHPFPTAVIIPKCAQDGTSDYEAELCVVIGENGRDIPEGKTLEHVLGYTASNDISAGKFQTATRQWSFSKGLDHGCPIGPILISTSVIENLQSLQIRAIYNGRTIQDGHTRNMIFNVKRLIASVSQGTTLEAGTIILTGTPAGIGYFRQPRVFLGNGDIIGIQIKKIGTFFEIRFSMNHSNIVAGRWHKQKIPGINIANFSR